MGVRVVTAHPYHALFAKTMFIDLDRATSWPGSRRTRSCCTRPSSRPTRRSTGRGPGRSSCCTRAAPRLLVGGTFYAGEIKKSIFTVMNDRLPLEGVLPMHCSANVGADGTVAVFFGLSGTGKTTLSADPTRALIGDDEHGWGDDGVFNFEGGCYAKTIRLSADGRAGDLEGRALLRHRSSRTSRSTRTASLDLDDDSKTENTRAAYKLEQIANALPAKRAGHPLGVIFLTADAFGILPPIARLSRDQALYYFLSGFTAKLAGTEIGVTRAAADLLDLLRPAVPAAAARRSTRRCSETKLDQHGSKVWLVNTGWTGGPVRRRRADADPGDPRACSTPRSRATSTSVDYRTDDVFGFEVPRRRCRASTQSCSTRARPGPTRHAYDRKGASSPRCSSPTELRRRRVRRRAGTAAEAAAVIWKPRYPTG